MQDGGGSEMRKDFDATTAFKVVVVVVVVVDGFCSDANSSSSLCLDLDNSVISAFICF